MTNLKLNDLQDILVAGNYEILAYEEEDTLQRKVFERVTFKEMFDKYGDCFVEKLISDECHFMIVVLTKGGKEHGFRSRKRICDSNAAV